LGYEARRVSERGVELCLLSGPEGRAVVVPGAGSQLASLWLAPGGGAQPVELLAAPAPELLGQAGWGAGAPILFPFPGRVAEGSYAYRGRVHRLPPGGQRHPLHGFVGLRPWEVEASGTDERGAFVRTSIAHADLRLPRLAFPGTYRLEVTHRIGPGGYAQEIAVHNVGDEAFPFGYGWHPYFRAPLGRGGSRSDCLLRVPADARWELTADLLPTGRRLAVAGPYDLRRPSPLGDRSFDDPFTLLRRDGDGWTRAELADPATRLCVQVGADASFETFVVYGPRTAATVCLEPYTCAPDAYNLHARGLPAGLRELEPGQTWRGALAVSLRPWSWSETEVP
jgi:aldose 1-epimerase